MKIYNVDKVILFILKYTLLFESTKLIICDVDSLIHMHVNYYIINKNKNLKMAKIEKDFLERKILQKEILKQNLSCQEKTYSRSWS